MHAPTQTDCETFRLILVRNEATELLVRSEGTQLALPTLDLPRHARIAEAATSAIRTDWGMETCCLFARNSSLAHEQSFVRYLFLELYRSPQLTPKFGHWVPTSSLSAPSFADKTDFAAIHEWLAELADPARTTAFFARPGWFRDVFAWVAREAKTAGLRFTGEFQQLNASPTFGLIRFTTNGRALWFKAVGDPNLRELPLSMELASLFPEFLPLIVGSRKQWNAWLTLEADGVSLDQNPDPDAWTRASDALARLQVASVGRTLHLLNVGARDVRIPFLIALVDPFFEAVTERMKEQTKPSPAPLSRDELFSLAAKIKASLGQLADGAIPNALGHFDLNPGNIFVSSSKSEFLDWAEAAISHPFFTFQYLLEHARRSERTETSREEMERAYAIHWEPFTSREEIAAALRATPLLAAFAYAVTALHWKNDEIAKQPEAAGFLRALVRRMNREANALRETRLLCVP